MANANSISDQAKAQFNSNPVSWEELLTFYFHEMIQFQNAYIKMDSDLLIFCINWIIQHILQHIEEYISSWIQGKVFSEDIPRLEIDSKNSNLVSNICDPIKLSMWGQYRDVLCMI